MSRFIKLLVIWPYLPIDPLTHPSTHPSTHPPMGEDVSTNHNSTNRTELSQLGQDLFNF